MLSKEVLIVDDDPSFLDLMDMVLEDEGYRPITVGCGEEALDLLQQHSIPTVILDILLPGMNGLTLAERIKEVRGMKDACLICVTGDNKMYQEAVRRGKLFNKVIIKPFDIDELLISLQ